MRSYVEFNLGSIFKAVLWIGYVISMNSYGRCGDVLEENCWKFDRQRGSQLAAYSKFSSQLSRLFIMLNNSLSFVEKSILPL